MSSGNQLFSPKNNTYYHKMKIEWLITDVTAVRSPVSAECPNLFGDFGIFVKLGRFCSQGGTLGSVNPLLDPKNPISEHLMKIEQLITNITAVGSPNSAESKNNVCFCMFLANSGRFCDRGATL